MANEKCRFQYNIHAFNGVQYIPKEDVVGMLLSIQESIMDGEGLYVPDCGWAAKQMLSNKPTKHFRVPEADRPNTEGEQE